MQSTTPAKLTPEIRTRTNFSLETLTDFCNKWDIASLAVFGSVLRSDFGADSDIDCLVSFTPEAKRSLLTRVRIKHELESMVGRPIDVVARKSVEESDNWIRRHEILSTAQTIYEQT